MKMLFRLSMQSSVGRDLCQTGMTIFPCDLYLSNLLFKGRDNVSPTFLIYINFCIRIGEAQVNSASKKCGGIILVVYCFIGLLQGDLVDGRG
jgi:hypothetical protein